MVIGRFIKVVTDDSCSVVGWHRGGAMRLCGFNYHPGNPTIHDFSTRTLKDQNVPEISSRVFTFIFQDGILANQPTT